MIITETPVVTTKDELTAVHAVRFSHPTPDTPVRHRTEVPSESADSHECAPVRFLAPDGMDDVEARVRGGQVE
jgi:hypothetical protein